MSEDKDNGWVSIHRKITNHWVWSDKPFSYGQAWIDLIMLANRKNHTFLSHDRRNIDAKRGVVYLSITALSQRWGWKSRNKTRHFLSLLEKDGMVVVNGTSHGTTITLVNYDKFQYQGATKGQQKDSRRTAEGQQKDTNNKDKKENKENNPPLYSPQRGDVPTGKLEDMDPEEKRKWRDAGWRIDNDGEWVNIGE